MDITKDSGLKWWNKIRTGCNLKPEHIKNDGILKEILVHCNDGIVSLPIPN